MKKMMAIKVSAMMLICCSLAIFNALQEIPNNEIYETISHKNDRYILKNI